MTFPRAGFVECVAALTARRLHARLKPRSLRKPVNPKPMNIEPPPGQEPAFLLIVNSGSSSIKFALFQLGTIQSRAARPACPSSQEAGKNQREGLEGAGETRCPTLGRVLSGKFERVGFPDGKLHITDAATGQREDRSLAIANHAACVRPLIELLEKRASLSNIRAVGHRVVHGGS